MYFYDGCFALSKKTLSILKETENEAIIQLKKNQKRLFELVETITKTNKPISTFKNCNKDHGRIDSRKTQVFDIPELSKMLDKEWNNISCVVKVDRTRKLLNSSKKGNNKSKTNEAYYISTKTLPAKKMSKIIQGHWGIENKVNYVKDTQFKEDDSRIRVKPGIFSRLRGIALNILRFNNVKNISQGRFINCCNIDYALNCKGIA